MSMLEWKGIGLRDDSWSEHCTCMNREASVGYGVG